MSAEPEALSFADFELSPEVQSALSAVGYETPTAIQAETIPHMLAGRDVVGQAQTGTGKTAAFALPLLTRIDRARIAPQVLVLTPTRELAIQVAEAFQRYAAHLPGFHVLPIYGGQDYGVQLRGLRRGVHVVVGTPGRVMDHMRRATLNLVSLQCLVLDEADEMLRMGFIEDVEWILEQTPPTRQVALFSATMPPEIRAIAERHLREPQHISIRHKTTTAATIRQRYWRVSGTHKLDALTRILETENYEGVLIFVRTKLATSELAERLEARGYACAAINGDMPQRMREKTIEDLRSGQLDLLVATDVAARGLDVERISHVINYDIPNDPEVYVHRIGRTGRAGRAGDAILFVAPREQRMLRVIERSTNQPIEPMELPSAEAVNDKRVARFMQQVDDTLAAEDLEFYRELVLRFQRERDVEPSDIAAALARLLQGDEPMLLAPEPRPPRREEGRSYARDDARDRPPRGTTRWQAPERAPRRTERFEPRGERPGGHTPLRQQESHYPPGPAVEARAGSAGEGDFGHAPPRRPGPRDPAFRQGGEERPPRPRYAADEDRARPLRDERPARERYPDARDAPARPDRPPRRPEAGMESFRLEVGRRNNVMPGQIVGAIANEAGLDARSIGRIQINEDHSTVDLPLGMPKDILYLLKKVWVAGQQLRISRVSGTPPREPRSGAAPGTERPPKKDRHRDRKNKGAPKRAR